MVDVNASTMPGSLVDEDNAVSKDSIDVRTMSVPHTSTESVNTTTMDLLFPNNMENDIGNNMGTRAETIPIVTPPPTYQESSSQVPCDTSFDPGCVEAESNIPLRKSARVTKLPSHLQDYDVSYSNSACLYPLSASFDDPHVPTSTTKERDHCMAITRAIYDPYPIVLAFCLCYEFRGPWSNGCTMHVLMEFGEFMYIFGGWCPESWRGFSLTALNDIFPVVKLSISSGVMVCVRVANELGRGDAKVAKFSIKVLISTSTLIGLLFWVLCLVFGNKIGYLFTKDEEVARSVSDLSILLAFSVLLNGIYPVLTGVAIGAGLQTKMAIINLICFYLIGLPIGAVLGYVTHLPVKGIWIEMISGVVAQTLALIFMTWRTNWDKEVCITSSRLNRWYLKSEEENNLETK
ncbi:hypothetical protein BUALT_Bualt16G0106200 [Buddleja alternifolia]|uniref:Uncharacterized protein n=1 Tax=Buddleja alternifolia TaxID=168488 RepID=A0AAV6WIW2_9LAMI|nr:hypothetical protein BUALT_Bualt16G0106200 [Buddleja alternifolia]